MTTTTVTPIPASAKRMTSQEAADHLGVRVQTLAVWRRSKRHPDLPYIKVSQHVRYRRADLDRWLESRTHGSPDH
jgi:excisionase family DNA binding protein